MTSHILYMYTYMESYPALVPFWYYKRVKLLSESCTTHKRYIVYLDKPGCHKTYMQESIRNSNVTDRHNIRNNIMLSITNPDGILE